MMIHWKRDIQPSRIATESYDRARHDLDEQQRKHTSEAPIRNSLKLVLEENHLAQLVYNALQGHIIAGGGNE